MNAFNTSPWGAVQYTAVIAEGITEVVTAGHGGIHLSAARAKQLPPEATKRNFLKGSTWWEEDCDWCIPFLVFAEDFKAYYAAHPGNEPSARTPEERFEDHLVAARRIATEYHPEFLAAFDLARTQLALF